MNLLQIFAEERHGDIGDLYRVKTENKQRINVSPFQ